jgi:sigma-B regulation protein RsbU (phosphoserine phosphatase)
VRTIGFAAALKKTDRDFGVFIVLMVIVMILLVVFAFFMALRLAANIKRMQAKTRRLEDELLIAADIQKAMLPRIEDIQQDGFTLFAKMESARDVGGDFYDFWTLPDRKLALVIADVSGKGAPAALFMAVCKTLLRQQFMNEGSPAKALTGTNRLLSLDNKENMFVTVFAAVLDAATGRLTYSSAGHTAPLFARTDAPFAYLPLKRAPPCGLIDGVVYEDASLDLGAGGKLYLYTDGFTEAMDTHSEMWGMRRFLEAANAANGQPADEFDTALRYRVRSWEDGAGQSDDLTSIAVLLTA